MSDPNQHIEPFVLWPEIAEKLKKFLGKDVSRRTVEGWIERQGFPAYEPNWPGRERVWPRRAILEWFAGFLRGLPGPEVDPTCTPRGFAEELSNREIVEPANG